MRVRLCRSQKRANTPAIFWTISAGFCNETCVVEDLGIALVIFPKFCGSIASQRITKEKLTASIHLPQSQPSKKRGNVAVNNVR